MMLYIVRHGQTDWNIINKRQGHTNIPLNEEGKRQAKKLKEKLKDIHFDYVFSSPLDRAYDTAKIITDQKIIIDERLIERYNGRLEGLTREEIHKLREQEDYSDEKYGAESISDLQKRANSFLKDILSKYPNKNILVVTHTGLIMNMRCFLDGEVDDISKYVLNNCEVYKYDNENKNISSKK